MQSAVEKLRKYRDENHRSYDEIVEIWTQVLSKRNLSSLGDEKWLILEQVFKSALHCSKQSIARQCFEQLEKQFKTTSRRVTTLNAMFFESIGEFERAEEIYAALLEDNETDAIVRKRQISLLKEQNQTREAINELNAYLEVYQADQEAWSELCDLYLSEHDYNKAAFCAEELLLINPHNHLNHERYASIRYSQGDYGMARTYYFSALKINPANMRALYGIILSSTNLGAKVSSTNTRAQNSNENNPSSIEQNQWARDQIIQKYRETLPDVLPMVESALQYVEMDLQNKYQILASEFSKVRGQVTVLKKAVIDEQSKNQQLQEDINTKDQDLRRNAQEIETLSFLNKQLKSRLEKLQQELNDIESNAKLKKTNSNRVVQNSTTLSNNVLAQELEQKIQQYEIIQRRVYEFEKQITDVETERSANRSTIEQLQNQMEEMQESHQRTRDEYERILKQLKQENELLNDQMKHHINEQSSTIVASRKSSMVTLAVKSVLEPAAHPQPEILLHKSLHAWRDAFTELTIYIEERLKNNDRSSETNDKMTHTVRTFQRHAENFLVALKTRLFDEKSFEGAQNTTDFAELFSMFVSSCEQVVASAIKSVCDEPKFHDSYDVQEKIYAKIYKLNDVLNQLFHQWMINISQLREIAVAIIQFDSSLPNTTDQLQSKIVELLTAFHTGAIIHCDLDKNYNDKLCLEYELSASPVHLTTTDECILAALRKLAGHEQQIAQLIRENQTYFFEFQQRPKGVVQKEQNHSAASSDDSCQQLLDVQKKQILCNAETIGTLEQEKEHWRLEYQLLKIKFEKMRDDHCKQIEELKDKANQAVTTSANEGFDNFDELTPKNLPTADERDDRASSDIPGEREIMIKQHYSQKIQELETKLQLVNGKGIAFYNELANFHQRLRYSKDQEAKCRTEIEQSQRELTKMRDELATTTKGYEEQIAMMSEHLASMNEQITSQNEKIDKLQQQLHTNPKDGKKNKK